MPLPVNISFYILAALTLAVVFVMNTRCFTSVAEHQRRRSSSLFMTGRLHIGSNKQGLFFPVDSRNAKYKITRKKKKKKSMKQNSLKN